jgi:hypothetical protein
MQCTLSTWCVCHALFLSPAIGCFAGSQGVWLYMLDRPMCSVQHAPALLTTPCPDVLTDAGTQSFWTWVWTIPCFCSLHAASGTANASYTQCLAHRFNGYMPVLVSVGTPCHLLPQCVLLPAAIMGLVLILLRSLDPDVRGHVYIRAANC